MKTSTLMQINKLKEEVKEMEESLNDLLLIVELKDEIFDFTRALDEMKHCKEIEKIPHIQFSLRQTEDRKRKYKEEVDHLLYRAEGRYSKEIENDYEWLEAISKYIRCRFEFEENTEDMYNFIQTRKGQCYHFSRIFRDCLRRRGIEAYIVKGHVYGRDGLHAWNKVIVDNKTFYYDLAFALTDNSPEKWIHSDSFEETHIPLYEL